MNIPILNSVGQVHRDPTFFEDAIEFTLNHWSHEMEGGYPEWTFLTGASVLAAEVFASSAEWEPIALRYAAVALREGMLSDEIDRLLALAWEWAGYRPGCWIEMCGAWIYVEDLSSYFHLSSGRCVDGEDFLSLFDAALTDPDGELKYVFHHYPVSVDRVISDQAKVPGFYELEGALVFNAA